MIQRVEARLRPELQQEHAAVEAAVADEARPEEPAAAADAAGPDAHPLVAPPLDGGAYQPGQAAVPGPVGAPVEPGHDKEEEPAPRRRTTRTAPGLFLTLPRTVASDPPPDEPPPPQAQSP